MMKDIHTEGPGRLAPMIKGLGLGSALVAATLALGGAMAARADDDHEGLEMDDDSFMACSKTSHVALRACRNDVRDDFWTTIGNCANLSDDDDREACVADAKAARQEARGDCADQFHAREEVCDALGQAPYDPQVGDTVFVDPSNINAGNANPYFPLVPGTKWVWKTTADGEVTETIIDTIDGTTKEILGVTTIVVHDEVREGDDENGDLLENTEDYYAQDMDGNVWYFGESSQELEEGEIVSIDGSWKAGRDFGKQGTQMKAIPQVDDVYRQEFALTEAEDLARVVAIDASETSGQNGAFSCSGDCVHTQDFTPLEPGTFEDKFYAPGVGVIVEINDFADPAERVELVEKSTIPVVSP